ncbi:glycoside hydrolase family 130 protein [Effusibacillus pohliae]|uniref:glycoside hydrolase family 130 protein n=1 Tax=Effusibacillus pohliae TaxID=232270 RepID=UPI000381459F|nr:hypothetical protein [Effusibacillus pohliae]
MLLSKEDPAKVLKRTEQPFFAPSTQDEVQGQVDNVMFVEGLVEYKGAYSLYYGMADSRIGVTIFRP